MFSRSSHRGRLKRADLPEPMKPINNGFRKTLDSVSFPWVSTDIDMQPHNSYAVNDLDDAFLFERPIPREVVTRGSATRSLFVYDCVSVQPRGDSSSDSDCDVSGFLSTSSQDESGTVAAQETRGPVLADPDPKPVALTKPKSCVVASMCGNYQPIFYEWQDAKDVPKAHLFFFDGYVQSPFDVPPVNVSKYITERAATRERREHRKRHDDEETCTGFCDICRSRVKGSNHRESARHRTKVQSLDWSELDFVEAELLELNGGNL